MAEVYTPTADAGGGSGIGGTLFSTGGSMALERGARVYRTMKSGAYDSDKFTKTWMGWKQTANEMERFSNKNFKEGASFNWRKNVKGQMLGSAWAPSSWAMSADLMRDPSLVSGNLLNLAEGKSWGAKRVAATAGWVDDPIYGTVYDKTRWAAANSTAFKYTGSEATSRATSVVNGLLNGGQGGATKKSPLLDTMWNLWFKGDAGNLHGPGNTTLYGNSSIGWIDDWLKFLQGGVNKRAAGAAGLQLSKFGATATSAFAVGGAALTAYNWASMAYLGAKTAYKGFELYNIKAPMAAYKSVGGQLLRPAFSSGDSALLTGIPASNRMRSVQAIQGSRLNARSALGNEASMLSGHFG